MGRSRRELSNEYLLAKIGVDAAENEPFKVRFIFGLPNSMFTDVPHRQANFAPSSPEPSDRADSRLWSQFVVQPADCVARVRSGTETQENSSQLIFVQRSFREQATSHCGRDEVKGSDLVEAYEINRALSCLFNGRSFQLIPPASFASSACRGRHCG